MLPGITLLAVSLWAFSLEVQANEAECAALAQQEFGRKQGEFKHNPQDLKAAWELGRACFDLADFATNRNQRAELAEQGIEVCRKALANGSNSAPVHYYLALNLGQLARTRTFGALKLVSQMEREFSWAIELDSHFDYGGPERSLGLLYRDAPAIGSIGSRTKARQHLERAVELSPGYPDNRLSLIESYLKWGDREGAQRQLRALKEAWPRARLELSGANWNCSWDDWQERLHKMEKKLGDGSKPLESPRTKS